ncbi:multiple epidermal growth factor-like domains protein 6 [Biomphalaria pfeifferi]|uniref:Multiple epidermal growth factor-like domains protein 6 n=1 Tax=Biomphalaria pfeifferi TaxID=112525 RepID=A0AAD8F157_BIOPF|nr:multiple epidermal growth factor-like domains protein 6 [Biomphalaria pfeifferi]
MHLLNSIIAVYVILCAYQHSAQACEEGWFGPECQYKCRCQESCSSEGECPDKCQDGWFGYKCQYRLVQYKAKTFYSEDNLTTVLNDNDEATCIQIEAEPISINLTTICYNPWIRLFTLQPDLLYTLEISFLDNNSQYVKATLKERLLVQDNVVDIHISVNYDFIHYIILQGEAIQRICSLWILSGQNVATKQNVYHSNLDISEIDTDLPQYPQASDGVYTCNTYDSENAGIYWEIVMNSSFVINEYSFYFNDVLGVSNFTFQRFNDDGKIYNTFNSTEIHSANSYGLITISKTITKAFTFELRSSSTNTNLTFLLCEVEAFTECSEGTWGVQCTNTCNENCPDLCRFDDGLCNNGCFGYSDPPRCTIACAAGSWGLNCTKTCSNHCFNSLCDRVTGLCDIGCIGYSDPPRCSTECDLGFSDFNCMTECNSCVDSSCDSKTGWCVRGCVGFSNAPYCTIACEEGRWGFNCSETCSNQCFNSTCDRITGLCDKGCIEYSDPPYCTKACGSGTWGLNCTKTCSNFCLISSCDRVTGLCDRGCIGYRDPPHCTTDCETGFWGINCINKCNRCVDLLCNSKTGWCDSGCVGFSDAPHCTTACATGSWGVNCTNKCSNSCVELSCDSVTGFCDLGCMPSTNCTLLLEASESFSQQTALAIAISIALAVTLAIVIGFIVLKVNGKLRLKPKENAPDVTHSPKIAKDEDAYHHISKLEHEDYSEMNETENPNISSVYNILVIHSSDEHAYHLHTSKEGNDSDAYCEMNAPCERNSYTNAQDPNYFLDSCKPGSEANDIAVHVESNRSTSTYLNPVNMNANQQIDYLNGNSYEKQINSF